MTLQIARGGHVPNYVTVRHRYCVYGIVVVSDTPLALPQYSDGGLAEVECLSGSASFFHRATRDVVLDPRAPSWYRYAPLGDGSSYVRWESVGEFLVTADGRRITYRRVEGSSIESFEVYLLLRRRPSCASARWIARCRRSRASTIGSFRIPIGIWPVSSPIS